MHLFLRMIKRFTGTVRTSLSAIIQRNGKLYWTWQHKLPYIEKKFGKYPYKQYSFIQGGDGGMEYRHGNIA